MTTLMHMIIKDSSMYERVVVVSDVHGCLEPLDRLLRRLAVSDNDLVIFVGDLVNKGPDGPGVVRRVRSLKNALSVRGNHEDRLNKNKEISDLHKFTSDEIYFMKNLPLSIYVEDRNILVVHAGVKEGVPMDAQKKEDLLTMRTVDVRTGEPSADKEDKFHKSWASLYKGHHFVVFGHHAKCGLQREQRALGIDTGCVYGGQLTAAVFRADLNAGYEIVQVENRQVSQVPEASICVIS